jgi:PAS domain S-box-containing protein
MQAAYHAPMDEFFCATDDADQVRLIFELAPIGLCLARDRVVLRCNRPMSLMLGYAEHELHGRSFEMLYPSREEFERIGAQGHAAMTQYGAYFDERIMRHKNGSLFWCHVYGRALDPDRPFALAVWMFEDISARRPLNANLTIREREIIRQLALGLPTKQIARQLNVSPRTIDGHRARIMKKLGANSASELIAKVSGWL